MRYLVLDIKERSLKILRSSNRKYDLVFKFQDVAKIERSL